MKEEDLIFPNFIGGAYRLDNYRTRHLKKGVEQADLKGITFQAMRRTCGTLMNRKANVKDIQAHLRHSKVSTTLNEYIQQVPDSVRQAVD